MKIRNIPPIEEDIVHVIIETPQGSHFKYAYNPTFDSMKIKYELPKGYYFPINFGFIPQTLAEDKDPLDALVIAPEPLACGVLVEGKILGALAVRQEKNGKMIRNDRILVVPKVCAISEQLNTIKNIGENELAQLEHFFISYNEYRDVKSKFLKRLGPGEAKTLIVKSMKNYKNQNKE